MHAVDASTLNPFEADSGALSAMIGSLMEDSVPRSPEEIEQRRREDSRRRAEWNRHRYGRLSRDVWRIVEGHSRHGSTYVLERRPPTLRNLLAGAFSDMVLLAIRGRARHEARVEKEKATLHLRVAEDFDEMRMREAAEAAARAVLDAEAPGRGARASFVFVWNERL